jgi:putative PIN family toxin of toxin-antitoxin system
VRAVVDTNGIVSGIFWSGLPGRVLDAWVAGAFALPVTEEILDEYFEVIDRIAAKLKRDDLAVAWKSALFHQAEMVKAPHCFKGCRDPNDAMFVECAMSAGARYLVSGDEDLLVLGNVGETAVVTPAQFLACLDQ